MSEPREEADRLQGEFDLNGSEVRELLEHAAVASDQRAWPRMLASIVDLYSAHFQRRGMPAEAAAAEARQVAALLAHYFGGRMYYLPRDERLRRALRDTEIWQRWNGRNIDALMREFGLGIHAIYRILAAQRALRRGVAEPELFPPANEAPVSSPR